MTTKAVTVAAKLIQKTSLTTDVTELVYQPEPQFSWVAGQFISILIPGAGPGGRDLRRAYSIASSPDLGPTFQLCVKIVPGGPGSNYLADMAVGQAFSGMAPFGDFVFKTAQDRDVVFFATGTGLAPFRAMIASQSFPACERSRIYFGVRTRADVFYREELSQALGDRFQIALSREPSVLQAGETAGRITEKFKADLAQGKINLPGTDFYLCGSGAMIDELKTFLMENGVQKSAIHQEVYYKG